MAQDKQFTQHAFINGICSEKARTALSTLAELQTLSTEELDAALKPHREVLMLAASALQDIYYKLRMSCKED